MSVVFVVVPAVSAGWPVMAAAIGAACAAMGYTAHRTLEQRDVNAISSAPIRQRVELEMSHAEVIGEALSREQSVQFEKDGVVATFTKDARGNLGLHVDGELGREELTRVGQQLLNQVRQQYACEKVKSEVLTQGFSLVDEHVDEQGNIRLKVRRFR
ncbi:MAG: DUF1257 domain-containing protein [Armatimonadetes bacterium]|nr:DUF1257 domain-containing protein [Armatimonadota bacterium]